jgi:hypothetical protein
MVLVLNTGVVIATLVTLITLLAYSQRRALRWAARFVFGLGRWRYKCPVCVGTGICQSGGHPDHSCCGDCRRVEVPRSRVPAHFKTIPGWSTATLGCGYLKGSLWDVLRHGRWRPAMHHCPDVATEFSRWI